MGAEHRFRLQEVSADRSLWVYYAKTRALEIIGFDPEWDDVDAFLLTYGTPPHPVALREITKGQWHELIFEIRRSQGDDGYSRVWLDGQDMTDGRVEGPNMWNRASHYFKFGLYRNPGIPHTATVFYDDIKIGGSRDHVE